jgi:hemolysin activation/secretion protein
MGLKTFGYSVSVFTLSIVIGNHMAFAQQQIPSTVDPGRVEKRFETPVQPKSSLEPIIPKMEGSEPPAQAEQIKFNLIGIVVEGSSIYSDVELQSLYGDYLGKEVSLKTIYDIANTITKKYGDDGYALSRATVPPQRIKNGTVHIRILEGFIDKVIVEGKVSPVRGFFKEFERKIIAEKPINAKTLERYLLLANDLPGMEVKSVLKASKETPGASNLVFTVQEKPFDLTTSLDNRGTNSSGPHQMNFGGGLNNMFGLYERTNLNYTQTPQSRELKYFALSHEETLTAEGLKLTLSANKSLSKPGTRSLLDLDLISRSRTLSAGLSYPLIRSRAENMNVSGTFTHKNTWSRQLGAKTSQDRLRTLKLGVSYDKADSWQGVNQIGVELHQGLHVLNATDKNNTLKSRTGGRSDFTKMTLSASRTQQLPNNLALYGAVMAQRSAHRLLSSEECGIGGEQFGRAYDSSEITGEHCMAASLELRYTPPTNSDVLKYTQFYSYYDIGQVYDITPVNEPWRESAASLGGGIRFGITDMISGSFDVAKPLTRPVSAQKTGDGDNLRAFFRLTAKY